MVEVYIPDAKFTLALLKKADKSLQEMGVKILLETVHCLWPEYYEEIRHIEKLYTEIKDKHLVAYALSQIFFYANEVEKALQWIMRAADYFDINKRSFFNDAILPLIIKRYIALSRFSDIDLVDKNSLASMVDQVLQNSAALKLNFDNKILIGIAIDTKKYDFLEKILSQLSTSELNKVFDAFGGFINTNSIEERKKLLMVFYEELKKRGWDSALQQSRCLFGLLWAEQHAELLCLLWTEGCKELALQISAELIESNNFVYSEAVSLLIGEFLSKEESFVLENFINGNFSHNFYTIFLNDAAVPDTDVLKIISNCWKPKDSLSTNAMAFAVSTLLKGTQRMNLIKEYSTQLEKVKNWASFSFTACLGHIFPFSSFTDCIKELKMQETSSFCKGGELFARGIAYYARGGSDEIKKTLITAAKSDDQIFAHGAFLSLGLRYAFSNDDEVVEACKLGIYSEKATLGEAAAFALGFVKASHWDAELSALLINFCRENDHDKITRSLTIFFGLSALNCADPNRIVDFFDSYVIDNDATIRSCAVNAAALAFVGTGNSTVISRLLNVIGGDVSSDVRRSAVIGLAFILINKRARAIPLLSMLATNYNSHVRHAVALSLGLISNQVFDKRITKLLRKLLDDRIDHVRQAAAVAFGLVYQLANEQTEPGFETIRKILIEKMERKQESSLAKLGYVMGLALTSPGGGNCALALSTSIHVKYKNIAPMFAFTNFWYWFPCLQLLPLALEPSFIVGIDANLRVPTTFIIHSKAPKKYFDYIRPSESSDEKRKEIAPVQLSTTRRAKLRQEKKEADKEIKNQSKPEMIIEEVLDEERGEKPEGKEEKKVTTLANPSRIVKKQIPFIEISSEENTNYVPVLDHIRMGYIFLVEKKRDASQTYYYEYKISEAEITK